MIESLYIHVPFCLRKKCVYCDFVSVPFDRGLSERYAGALAKEIEDGSMTHRDRSEVKTLFIGGGTPTALDSDQLKMFLATLSGNFNFSPDAEVTVEANPATVDGQKAAVLLRGGVNRISIGAQSFDGETLKLLDRAHCREDTDRTVRICRAAGFENIGLDLIYGVPGQKREDWRRTLESALRLSPTHISAYELTVEQGTGLWELVKSGALRMPPEDEVLQMSADAGMTLEASGFTRYEVSNYALSGFECRHNLNYWRRGQYLGFGAAAHSFLGERRWQNTSGLDDYIARVEAGLSPVGQAETLSKGDEERELVFLGLRTTEGLLLPRDSSFSRRIEVAARQLVREGFLVLEIEQGRLRATPRGFDLLDSVISGLLEGLFPT
ncbi:MAG: radical SAM family heme chaperone HemW [Desulfobacteraceae bacterium]|nr:radical SAM family heme chaperone HemW [Desulfobacteraceae bacterium]